MGSIEKFEGYNTDVKNDRNNEKASAKKNGERGGTLKRYTGGVKRR